MTFANATQLSATSPLFHSYDFAIRVLESPKSDIAQFPLHTIVSLIAGTNNGKLMIDRIPQPARAAVPLLIKRGFLKRATFMEFGDAVRVAD